MSRLIPPHLDEPNGRHPLQVPLWYIVCAIGGRERSATAELGKLLRPRGLRVFCPSEKRWRRLPDRRRYAFETALFAGYLFAESTDDDFHLFRDVDGVRGLLSVKTSDGMRPFPVQSPGFIEALAFCQANGAFDHTITKGRAFSVGDDVRVSGGRFQGLVGKIAAAKPGAKRVKVMLQACGIFGSGPAELDVGLLDAA